MDKLKTNHKNGNTDKYYEEIVEHSNSIILRFDVNGVVTFLNRFGQKFFEYSLEEIVGKKLIGDKKVRISRKTGKEI